MSNTPFFLASIDWGPAARAATAVSLILCVLAWPEARIGVLVNLALGVWLVWGVVR